MTNIPRRGFLGFMASLCVPWNTSKAQQSPKETVVDVDWYTVSRFHGSTGWHWEVRYRVNGGQFKTEKRITTGGTFQLTHGCSIVVGEKNIQFVEDYRHGQRDRFGRVGHYDAWYLRDIYKGNV